MKKFFTFVIVFLLSFLCLKGNVFAKFDAKLESSSGKVAKYKITSSVKYTSVTVEAGAGVSDAKIVWNADGVSGTLTVTFSSPDCKGEVTLKYNASEGCDNQIPKNCEAILTDARSMIGKIPYEMGGKCSSLNYDDCQFGRKYTDWASYKLTHHEYRAWTTENAAAMNYKRYENSYALTGLDCSGYVWWIYYRNGYDLVGGTSPLNSSSLSGVSNVTSGSPIVHQITKEEAEPCDLVTSKKPENGNIPHVGIVSQTDKQGGWMYIHENGSDANVAENCYFDCKAPSQGKAVYYWRVDALWNGEKSEDSDSCSGKEPLALDNSEFCTCDTCDGVAITPEYISEDSVINNCCLNGDSHIREYYVSELFCSDKDYNTKVKYYRDQCNNDLYIDDTFDSLKNDYCTIRCTEEMDLKTPKEITSATGKFFKLAELTYTDLDGVSKTTKAPVITGNKTCTVKIKYDEWRKDYETAVKLEVSTYNEMQQNLAYYELLRDATKTSKEIENKITVNCTSNSEYEKDGTVAKDATYTDSSGNSKVCKAASCDNYKKKTKSPEVTCKNTYYEYKINPNGKKAKVTCSGGKCSIPYLQVKTNASFDDGKSFDGLKVSYDETKNATFDEITVEANEDKCSGAVTTFINQQSGWTCTAAGSGKTVPDDTTVANMKKKAEDYEGWAKKNKEDFSSYTASAEKLEDGMTTCQTMFHDTNLAAEDTATHDSSNYFKLNPSATFKYMQVYLDNNNNKNAQWNPIPYGQAKCSYKFKNEGVKDVDNVDQYWSDDLYKRGSEKFTDMKASEDFITSAEQIPLHEEREIEKKFRQDAQYDAQCNWDDADVPEQITLYPGPKVIDASMKSGEMMITQHKYQYALYLTTYATEYETYWEITDIGGSQRTKDKFIKAFNDAAGTCAQLNVAYSDGQAEATSTTSIKDTCYIKVKEGGMRIGTCETGIGSADVSCHDNEVREVFEFRIVDPKVMFPSGNWSDKAHNWKNDSGNWGTTKGIIEATAASDKTYAPDNLTYSFRLTTAGLKAIKDYNDTTTYDDFTLTSTDCPAESDFDESGCGTIDKPVNSNCLITENGRQKWKYTCRKFKSDFLKDLAYDTADDNGKLPASWNNTTTSLDNVRSTKNHWA